MSRLLQAWEEALKLEEVHAEHIKGFKLGFYPKEDILRYARLEIEELMEAPEEIHEMADLLACAIAYCARQGWTPDQVGQAIRKKLRSRFKNTEPVIGPFTDALILEKAPPVVKLKITCSICGSQEGLKGAPNGEGWVCDSCFDRNVDGG